MRKKDLAKGDQVLTRYKYRGKIVGFSSRYVIVFNGHKRINLHHSDIIEKIGGRRDEH